MSFIVLKDTTNRIRTFNLPHEVYCDARGRCGCSQMPFTALIKDRKSGKRSLKPTKKRICDSFTIHPGQESDPLPEEVRLCPEVSAALNVGSLLERPHVEVRPDPGPDAYDDPGIHITADEPHPDDDPAEAAPEPVEAAEDEPDGDGHGDDEIDDDGPPVALDDMNMNQLRDLASGYGIKAWGKRKEDLIKLIAAHEAGEGEDEN